MWRSNQFVIVTAILITIFVVFGWRFLTDLLQDSGASTANIIDTSNVTESSEIQKEKATIDVALYSDGGYLLQTRNQGEAAALEFLQRDPKYRPEELPDEDVKGVSDLSNPQRIIPQNFAQNSFLSRKVKDVDDRYYKKLGVNLNSEHYIFNQKINNVPVYGAELVVHIKNNNQVYAVDGNLVLQQTVEPERLSEDRAKEIALVVAEKEATKSAALVVKEVKQYIFNRSVLGLNDDTKNYDTYAITVSDGENHPTFAKKYFVELTEGRIVFSESLIYEVKRREIEDCSKGTDTSTCPVVRTEGDADTGDRDSDQAYEYSGEFYDFLSSKLSRDSYDNKGGTLLSRVNGTYMCPNAYWMGFTVEFCKGMASKDIVGHEFGHGVTQESASLIYGDQSGALNESVSDVFGYAMDNNWTIGEDTVMGIFRSMADPPSTGSDPDRLFSPNYACESWDNGGVHSNSGIFNKAFYLMTAGGNFNGCGVTGVGKEKSIPIIYRALTSYLTMSSNFKAMYDAIMQSCTDLYQASSNTCSNVKKSLEATEMDQQPIGLQKSPVCSKQAPRIPNCAASTTTLPTPTSVPTGSITADSSVCTFSGTNCFTRLTWTISNVPSMNTVTVIQRRGEGEGGEIIISDSLEGTRDSIIVFPPETVFELYVRIFKEGVYNNKLLDFVTVGYPITSTPSPPLTSTNTPVPPTNTLTPSCVKKNQGDANCDGKINIIDFEYWRLDYLGGTTAKGDFNGSGKTDMVDFEIWRKNFE